MKNHTHANFALLSYEVQNKIHSALDRTPLTKGEIVMRRLTFLILGLFGLIGVRSDGFAQLSDKELVSALQKGGYVIYMRHPRTNGDQADTDPLNLDNIKAQRQLTDEGRKQAKAVGKAFRALKIPVDKVVTSKFHRAYEAGKLLDVAEVTTSIDISERGLVVSPNENNRRAKALRQLLGTTPTTGKNAVIVGHKPNLIDAGGKDFVDTSEGEALIFQPLGDGKFKLVGRVTVDKWSQWAK
jgi:phosphohistidine phosphatase SixA